MRSSTFRRLRQAALFFFCAAAVAARFLWPGGAAWAEQWFLGSADNPAAAAFAALEDGMDDGVGAAVAAFCEEFSDGTGA